MCVEVIARQSSDKFFETQCSECNNPTKFLVLETSHFHNVKGKAWMVAPCRMA